MPPALPWGAFYLQKLDKMSHLKTALLTRRRRKYKFPMLIAFAILFVSILPTLLTIILSVTESPLSGNKLLSAPPILGRYFSAMGKWYEANIEPVQELRPLAKFPSSWEGRLIDVDLNYFRFEKWFADNLGLRDLMIRSKNELDYKIFRSSSRVYFGKDNDVYGRNLVDRELPATEAILDTAEKIEAIHRGVVQYSDRMKAQGITTIFVAPMQKVYFHPERLPFFAPRLPADTNFMSLYRILKSDKNINFVDVFGILQSLEKEFPIFYTQDFHWTPMAALAVSKDAVNRISKIEGSDSRWAYPVEIEYQPFVGSDARFSARLNTQDKVMEPQLVKKWKSVQAIKQLDASLTGFEFETNKLSDSKLLPPTCMYGNSFSDGMLAAGLADYFQVLYKIDRMRPLSDVPRLINGRCKYLIVQILASQTGHWLSFK